jgi:DNA-binding NarL/FixJ family response regulator
MSRILIADDHPLYRLALMQAVRKLVPEASVLEAATLDATRALLHAEPDTDLVLLDLHMPGNHGLMGLAMLRSEFPAVAIVMISAHDDVRTISRAIAYGAAGFIPKRADMCDLQTALRAVLNCENYVPPDLRDAVRAAAMSSPDVALAKKVASLSAQQLRVLNLVSEGRLNKQIADSLGIQERTVKAHMTAIFEKLGVRNRTQAGVLLRSLESADPAKIVGD